MYAAPRSFDGREPDRLGLSVSCLVESSGGAVVAGAAGAGVWLAAAAASAGVGANGSATPEAAGAGAGAGAGVGVLDGAGGLAALTTLVFSHAAIRSVVSVENSSFGLPSRR